MRPTRAAWLFAAGLSWMVLRGILARALPALDPATSAGRGGWLLLVQLITVAASFTAPVFFYSFLRAEPFGSRRALRGATVLAAAASVASFALVAVAFVTTVSGSSSGLSLLHPRVAMAAPLLLVLAILVFLVVFWRQGSEDRSLRRAAGVAAVGALFPSAMMVAWAIHASSGQTSPWYPAFSLSPVAMVLGLASAASLVWFLETFAVTYSSGAGGVAPGE
ncbi:MAG: hypothetical protein MUC56_12070 [Thermoanaerobaculales bacterium]|nr:hypothetical protein [Thermoanaerobaculales bacterium]